MLFAERNIKPAYPPDIALPDEEAEVTGIIDGKSDLAFTMSFEVVPPVEIADFSAPELTRHTVPVEDKDVEESTGAAYGTAADLGEKDGAAETGERVTISSSAGSTARRSRAAAPSMCRSISARASSSRASRKSW